MPMGSNILGRLIQRWMTGQNTNTSETDWFSPSVNQRGWGNLGNAYSTAPEFSVNSNPFGLNFGGENQTLSLLDLLAQMNPNGNQQPYQFNFLNRLGRY